MSKPRLTQGVAKVVFQNRTFRNGKNYIWIRISRVYLSSLENYWRNKSGFFYMKIYEFDRVNRVVGQQWGYITRTSSSNEIIFKPRPPWMNCNAM